MPAKLIDPCLSTIRRTSAPLVGCAGFLACLGTAVHLVVVVDQVTTCMGRDHDAVVGDVKQAV
ncbi:MAG: hypothetical protein H0U53_10085 [Actinobacteria bacterium]|nr:hypothetical protein [Actinomycetota bacterium]